MSKKAKKNTLAFEKIAELTTGIVDKALEPRRLCDYILNYCDDEAGAP
jgi:hypothetical protein